MNFLQKVRFTAINLNILRLLRKLFALIAIYIYAIGHYFVKDIYFVASRID